MVLITVLLSNWKSRNSPNRCLVFLSFRFGIIYHNAPKQEVKKLSFLRGVEQSSTKGKPFKKQNVSFALYHRKAVNAKGVKGAQPIGCL